MARPARSYTLTPELVASHGGGPVVCLDASATGRTYRLHAERPGPELNAPVRADIIGPAQSSALAVEPLPLVMRVDIRGPLEQRAGYHDVCGGWSDGYDAVAERLSAALEAGDVLLVVDSPGGAYAGLAECVRRIQEAKAFYGRRITTQIDEGCGSAAYWIVACVSDEVFGPASMLVGSIGARSAWCGVAGALAKDGIEHVHFAFPPGKVALASEMPLSEAGRARGTRDVMLAAEAFFAAVGPARGLSRDDLIALDADCLSGPAAVAAGLVDGVSSIEDVMAYALTMAARPEDTEGDDMGTSANTEYEKTTKESFKETDAPPETPEETTEGEEPTDPESKSAEDGDEEEAPPSSKPAPPPAARANAAARSASYASLAGLRAGASEPAIKTALSHQASVFAHASKLAGSTDPGKIMGALDAIAADASESKRLRTERDAATRKANASRRMDLLRALEAGGVHTRGELFADHVDPVTGARTLRPAKLWGPGPEGRPLANLEGYVKQKLATATPPASKSPFNPDPQIGESMARGARGPGITLTAIERAKTHPAVLAAASRPGAQPLENIARAHVVSFGGDQ